MAQMYMRFPGGKVLTLTFSYDDGVEQDIRLIEIFKKYNLKGTFNINAGLFAEEGTVYPEGQIHRRMTKSQCIKLYKNNPNVEVASHCYTHPFLTQVPKDTVSYEIVKDREVLEETFGTLVRGGAYAYGDYDDYSVECLKNAGIKYYRVVAATHNFYLPKDWLRLEPTCHHYDPNLMKLGEKFLNSKNGNSAAMFYIWGHSYEFEQANKWEVIEEFAEYISNKDYVWYATNIEIYDYIDAYKQLRTSVDGTIIYNPTNTELWFETITPARKMYSIKPGETIKL